MLPIINKQLFLKYAIPCGHILVKRGKITQQELDNLKQELIEKKEITLDLKRVFTVAVQMMSLLAKKMGKQAIDEEVIREYFWFEHDKTVEWRSKMYPDIIPVECRTYPARVLEIGEEVLVDTPIGKKLVSSELTPNIKVNDCVVIHYSFISEKISKKDFERLWEIKKNIK